MSKIIKFLIIIPLVWLLSCPYSLVANSELEELESQLRKKIDDTTKVIILNKIAKKYRDIDVDKGLNYAHTALELSSRLNYLAGKAESFKNIGLNYWRMGAYDISIDNNLKALALFEELNDYNGIATTNNNIGLVYLASNQFKKAIYFLQKSISYHSKIDDQIGISRAMLNIAIVYSEQKEYLGALDYHLKSLKICEPLKNPELIGTNYCFLGRNYINLKQFDSAFKYLNMSLEIFKNINSIYDIAVAYNQIALYYNKIGKYILSLENSNHAYKLGSQNKNKYLQMESLNYMSESYLGMKEFERAYNYRIKFQNLQDSITNEDNIRTIAQKEVEYAYAKKIRELEIQQQNELFKKSFLLYSVLIFSILLILVIIVIYYLYNGKSETNALLTKKNNEVERQKDELDKLNQELQISNSSKDKFFSIISHDLKSPFAGFIGLSRLLAEHLDDLSVSEIKDYAVLLKNSAEELYKLLENLLEWSRIQQGLIIFKPEATNIYLLVDSIINIYSSIASNKNIKINNLVPDSITLKSDMNMINTVFRNLISNALKFTKPGGAVSIGLLDKDLNNDDDKFLTFYVKDNGIGIPKNLIPFLFEIGINTSRIGTANESSTGLGLILCKEYINIHSGKIWVESSEGKGSSFYFTLPK